MLRLSWIHDVFYSCSGVSRRGYAFGGETFALRAGYSLIAVGSPPLVSSQYISSLFVLNVDVVGGLDGKRPRCHAKARMNDEQDNMQTGFNRALSSRP